MTWRKQIRTAGATAAAAALALSATLFAAERTALAPEAAAPRVSVNGAGKGAYRIEGSFRVETQRLRPRARRPRVRAAWE